ncbi:MAG TPA: hypothetical protein DF409_08690, partial [Bacteroidales bacterium]|nr:hypothetical protein [Bacteroidales bacterium]
MVAEAPGLPQRLQIIENFMLKRLHTINQRHFALVRKSVELLAQKADGPAVSKAAESLFVGNRQFERVFRDYV